MESAYGWLIGSGGVFVGAILLLWGGKLSRLLTAIISAGFGLGMAEEIVARSNMNPLTVRIGVACGCAIFGFILARFIWAALLASISMTAAAAAVLWHYLPEIEKKTQPAYNPAATQNAQQWAEESVKYSQTGGQAVWDSNYTIVLVAVGAAFVVPLIFFLLLPRFGRILATAIIGSLTLTSGLILVGATSQGKSLWPSDWRTWGIVGAVAGGLILLGIILQYIFTCRKAKKHDEQEDDEPAHRHKSHKSDRDEE